MCQTLISSGDFKFYYFANNTLKYFDGEYIFEKFGLAEVETKFN